MLRRDFEVFFLGTAMADALGSSERVGLSERAENQPAYLAKKPLRGKQLAILVVPQFEISASRLR
jgi:hypothetical protein